MRKEVEEGGGGKSWRQSQVFSYLLDAHAPCTASEAGKISNAIYSGLMAMGCDGVWTVLMALV